MHTRFLPVLALALASTVGCSQKPPTLTTTPVQPDTQRQIAAVNDGADAATFATQATVEQNLGTPLSVQELPQRLTADQLVELPADQIQQMETQADDQTQIGERSTQQWRGRGFGWRGFGFRGRGLRFLSYRNFYYPYYNVGSYYYPYAYYPYTYAYYPYSYYNYGYYPYYTPYYAYRSFYYPYGFSRFGYGRFGYGRFGYGRRWR